MNRNNLFVLCVFSMFFLAENLSGQENMNKGIIISGLVANYRSFDRSLKLEDFSQIKLGTTYREMVNIVGEPNGIAGSGLAYPYYELSDSTYILFLLGGFNFEQIVRISLVDENGNKTVDLANWETITEKAITISTPENNFVITLETLEDIKQKLLEVLRQQTPLEDFARLIDETENSTPFIFGEQAYIGVWKLINLNNELFLERQQIPRALMIRFFQAPLVWHDEQWKVQTVIVKNVRGRK